jgi:hypothetical protein
MNNLRKIVTIAIVAVTITLVGGDAARANEKISNIGENELMDACIKSQPAGVGGAIKAFRSERSAICFADVQITESGDTAYQAQSQASLSAKQRGISGSVNTFLESGGSNRYVAVIAQRSWSKSLTEYCRESHGNYVLHWLTNGRIFVAEGGFACHKGGRF